jgi:hypothetical protein
LRHDLHLSFASFGTENLVQSVEIEIELVEFEQLADFVQIYALDPPPTALWSWNLTQPLF